MPTGLAVPMKANKAGGIARVTGDENDTKIIRIALTDGDNDNAFQQDFTLGQSMIFDLNDATLRARITMRVIRIFERFEKQNRFKLFADTMKWTENSKEQTLELEFRYLNLESDEPKTFAHTFGAS